MARLVRKVSVGPCLGLLLCAAAAQAPPLPALYPPGGPQPSAVVQGALGSCYFHASIAALAESNPAGLARLIGQPDADSAIVVHFADGGSELVHLSDVEYARHNGFDLSHGIWVAVLLRAYAQRVLRASLERGLANSGAPAAVAQFLQPQIASSDLLLNAYDRAIRALVQQTGSFSADSLRGYAKQQIDGLNLPAVMRTPLESWLLSPQGLDGVAQMLQNNGEVFGAYRAAGNGGLPLAVLAVFGGPAQREDTGNAAQAALHLADAELHHEAVVADTERVTLQGLQAEGDSVPADASHWFVSQHAYTVLGFNGLEVTLRNPWGNHPDPDGVFQVPISEFGRYFPVLTIETGGS